MTRAFPIFFPILLCVHAIAMAASPFVRFESYPTMPIAPFSIAILRDTIWMGSTKGLIWVDTTTLHYGNITPTHGLPFMYFVSLSIGKNQELTAFSYLDPRSALSHRTDSGWNVVYPQGLNEDFLHMGVEHPSGTRFYLSYNTIYREDPDGTTTSFNLSNMGAYGLKLHLILKDTSVWFGTQSEKLCHLTHTLKCYDDDFPGVEPRAVTGGDGQPLYALIENSVLKRYNDSTDRFDSIYDFDIRNTMNIDHQGRLWMSNNDALYLFENGKESLFSNKVSAISCFAEDSLGRIWFTSFNNVSRVEELYRIEDDSLHLILSLDFPFPKIVYAQRLSTDSLGIPWYGSAYFTGKAWVNDARFTNDTWFTRAGLRFDITYAHGDMATCTQSRRFDGQNFIANTGCTPCSFLELDDGTLLGAYGDKGEYCEWDGNTWTPMPPDTSIDYSLRTQFPHMVRFPDGSFITGYFMDGANIRTFSATGDISHKSLFPGYNAYSTCLDSSGILWFTSNDNDLFRYDGLNIVKEALPYPSWAESASVEKFLGNLFVAPSGYMFLSSNMGVFIRDRLGTWTLYDGNDGICNSGGVFSDAGHGEVMKTNSSCIIRFATEEGDAFYANLQMPSEYPFATTTNEIKRPRMEQKIKKTPYGWDLLGRRKD